MADINSPFDAKFRVSSPKYTRFKEGTGEEPANTCYKVNRCKLGDNQPPSEFIYGRVDLPDRDEHVLSRKVF